MAEEKIKHLTLGEAAFKDFERLATSYKLYHKALLEIMIHYFKVTGIDPRERQAGNPTDAIKALDQRLISFIKQQEKEQLRPIKDELALITKKLYAFDDEEKGLGKVHHLRKMNERLKRIAEKLGLP